MTQLSPYGVQRWPTPAIVRNWSFRCGLLPLQTLEERRRAGSPDQNAEALVLLGQIDYWFRRGKGRAQSEIALCDPTAVLHAAIRTDRNGEGLHGSFGTARFEAALGQAVIARIHVPKEGVPIVHSFREAPKDSETAVLARLEIPPLDWSGPEGDEALKVLRTHHEAMRKHLDRHQSKGGSRFYLEMHLAGHCEALLELPGRKYADTREFRSRIREIYPGCSLHGFGPER